MHAAEPASMGLPETEAAASPHDIAPLQRLAEVLARCGREAEAATALADALAMDPGNRELQLALYRSARLRGRPAAALGYLTMLLARFPDEIGLLLDAAETWLDLRGTEDSERLCRRVLQAEPANRRAHVALLQAARIRGDAAMFAHRLEAAFAALPPDPELLVERGEWQLGRGQPEAAEADFAAALALRPDDRRARLGLFHAGRGRVPARLELARIEAVLEVSEPEPALRLDRAEAWLRLGRAEAAEAEAAGVLAEEQLAEEHGQLRALLVLVRAARVRGDGLLLLQRVEQARAVAPGNDELAAELDTDQATALTGLGRMAEAQAVLERLAARGDDLTSRLRLGQLARANGDRRAARSWFEQALARQPDHPEALLNACAELTALGEFAAAVALAGRLAALPGRQVDASLCHGFISRQMGDRPAALGWFRKAMAAAPEHDGAALNAAAELAELGQADEAARLAQSVLTRSGDGEIASQVEARLRLAHIAQLRPNRPEALRQLRAAAELAPANPEVLRQLAAESREQGLFDEADAWLDRLEELRPRALATLLARGQLARRRGDRREALRWFAAAHQEFPKAADALSEMALEQRVLNLLADSDASLRRALACEPGHIDAAMRLAEQELIAERHADCIALCREVRARQPHLLAAWLVECRAVAERDGITPALALLDGAGALVGPHPELLARRIDLLRDIGDYPAIRDLLAEASELATRHPVLWGSVMRALLRFGELEEIEIWLARAPASGVGMAAELAELRGGFAEANWRPDEALLRYHEALQLDPARHPLEQDIARVCLAQLQVEAAGAALQRYVQLGAGERSLRGESLKPTQTHVGQLLDEYRLDAATVAALVALKSHDLPERIAGARRIVGLHPDSTAAASFLLLSLRGAGRLGAARPGAGGGRIPRRIIQFWYQAEAPADVAGLMRSWPAHHAGYDYTRFDDAMTQDWLRAHHLPKVLTAYLRATQKAQKADLFRLAVLSVEGGIYADADDRCLAPFDPLLAGTDLLAYQEDYGTLGNNILACVPQHPVIRRAMVCAVEAINRGDNDLLWLSTGPGLLSRCFAQACAQDMLSLERCLVLDRRSLGRVMAMHCQVTYKATDNHWLQNLMK